MSKSAHATLSLATVPEPLPEWVMAMSLGALAGIIDREGRLGPFVAKTIEASPDGLVVELQYPKRRGLLPDAFHVAIQIESR